MRKSTVTALLALTFAATSAFAAVTTSWDFNSGTQGWTVEQQAFHGAPTAGTGASTMTFTDTDNGVYAAGTYSSGALYLPDKHYAYTEVAPTNSFSYTTLVMYNATNRMQGAGLGYHVAAAAGFKQDVSAWFEGKASGSSEMIFRDTFAAANNTQGQSGIIKNDAGVTPVPGALWLTVDYNNLIPGKVVLQARGENFLTYAEAGKQAPIPAGTPAQWTYNYALQNDPLTGQIYTVDAVRLGGAYSWSQFFADNVSFTDYTRTAVVPEPSSIVALLSGMVGMAGFAIRRRK